MKREQLALDQYEFHAPLEVPGFDITRSVARIQDDDTKYPLSSGEIPSEANLGSDRIERRISLAVCIQDIMEGIKVC